MPLIISVGLRQVGGLAASSDSLADDTLEVEVELGVEPRRADARLFQQQARAAFHACRQAVQEESARREACAATKMHDVLPIKLSGAARADAATPRNENARQPVRHPERDASATTAQVAVIRSLARRDHKDPDAGVGVLDVRSLAELSVLEAADLIEKLKGHP